MEIHGYKFKNVSNEIGGYSILKNKNTVIATDLGSPPEKKFSNNYQSGILSFEMIHLGKKLICNSGYYSDLKHQLNSISRSTAAHSTLVLNNNSVSHIKKDKNAKKTANNTTKVPNSSPLKGGLPLS